MVVLCENNKSEVEIKLNPKKCVQHKLLQVDEICKLCRSNNRKCKECEHRVCSNCWIKKKKIAKTSQHQSKIDRKTGEVLKPPLDSRHVVVQLWRQEFNLMICYAKYQVDNPFIQRY